jgi:hypothetical protein
MNFSVRFTDVVKLAETGRLRRHTNLPSKNLLFLAKYTILLVHISVSPPACQCPYAVENSEHLGSCRLVELSFGRVVVWSSYQWSS